MGVVKLGKAIHFCKLPWENKYPPDTIWKCDTCGAHWALYNDWFLNRKRWTTSIKTILLDIKEYFGW